MYCRLATEMSTKISKNEEVLENIAIKNRPMKVADEYSLFTNNAWLEAKERLDHATIDSVEAAEILTSILEVSKIFLKTKNLKKKLFKCDNLMLDRTDIKVGVIRKNTVKFLNYLVLGNTS